MKRKNGFTLIELLAVIIILAIIALIATPLVMDTVKDSRKSACSSSGKQYIKTVETTATEGMLFSAPALNGTYIVKDGYLYDKNDKLVLEVEVKGQKPATGTMEIIDNEVIKAELVIDKCALNYDGKNYVANLDDTQQDGPIVYPVGCELGPTPYGVTKTEKNTICFDGNIDHYPSIFYTNGGAVRDGEEIETRIMWVKISNKLLTQSNYDGTDYLIHYSNPGNIEEIEEGLGLTEDNCIGTGTGRELSVIEIDEHTALLGFIPAILSTDATGSFDELTPGIWIHVIYDKETGELLFYPDALTIKSVDFSGTSAKLPENADTTIVSNSKIETFYSGNQIGKSVTEVMRTPEENPQMIFSHVKVSDLTEQDTIYLGGILTELMTNPNAKFRIIGRMEADNAAEVQEIDVVLTSSELGTMVGTNEAGTIKYINYEGDPVFVLSDGGTLNGKEYLPGVYVAHVNFFGEWSQTNNMTYTYLQHFSVELLSE